MTAEILNQFFPLIVIGTVFIFILRRLSWIIWVPLLILVLAYLFPHDKGIQVIARVILSNLGGIVLLVLGWAIIRFFLPGRKR